MTDLKMRIKVTGSSKRWKKRRKGGKPTRDLRAEAAEDESDEEDERIFSNNYFQSTLLLFQLPASARGIGDNGVSTAQRAIVREILQRSAVDVRPADLRGLLCDLVCRVQFAHIKHT